MSWLRHWTSGYVTLTLKSLSPAPTTLCVTLGQPVLLFGSKFMITTDCVAFKGTEKNLTTITSNTCNCEFVHLRIRHRGRKPTELSAVAVAWPARVTGSWGGPSPPSRQGHGSGCFWGLFSHIRTWTQENTGILISFPAVQDSLMSIPLILDLPYFIIER